MSITEKIKNIQLPPCPFCGGKSDIAVATKAVIFCWDCGAQVSHKSIDEAVAKWCRRDGERKVPA
ncbi:MAG: Lar family restriction alleviation protein [Oscillospiraceae bacterium]|nr:Lar family restriction alleviation protein [Oscillospiraceae bacterium]